MDTEKGWSRGQPLDPAFLEAEIKTRTELQAGVFSRWERPGGHCLQEELTGRPERLFVFRLGERWYAGYKTISEYVLDRDMPGIFCSRVYWHNVVGELEAFRSSATDARVAFRPLDETARRAVFDAITPLTELVHPFAKQREQGVEKTSPSDGWLVSDERDAFLSMGEEHIRRYTKDRFGARFCALTEDVVAYDPACSTGRFLSDFATLNPARIRTVGQDVSREMVAYAKGRLERVHHGDAVNPAVEPGSAEIVFSRFLNSEVVSTVRAREMLPKLAATLRPGGSMVLLGHSPVLLDALDLAGAGLRVLQATARQDDCVFQYYVCESGD
ncbi:class I SAM-dependent methyltransferase [Streptomyces sp. P38-E01]|uniref:Class I SAM-dependent methyltransferase n=1 Tax=Streptomyces tardus TaxID=2780544 RepID=A0A949N4Z1_9ACTN|nr:class I SAM-dependent methyltransferase [Streptomyces tardus]MBU7597457.1 class I SAM-dependent methyltransferase [Streptomyces tardus]